MTSLRWHAILVLVALCIVAPAAQAQVAARSPHIGYVYPAGGRQGTTFQVTLGGQFLDGAAGAYVSGTGVQATVVEHVKPLTPQQANKLREQMMELVQRRAAAMGGGARLGKKAKLPEAQAAKKAAKSAKKPAQKPAEKPADTPAGKPGAPATWTAEDEKLLAEIRKKLATFVRRPLAPAIAETVELRITVAPDAEPGQREVRLGTSLGLSNPMVLCVGQLPEFSKPAAKAAPEVPRPKVSRFGRLAGPAPSPPEMTVTLPAVINGQIMPGAVDRFRFTARKGQRVVVAASARQLVPYLADAVPGWFQATLAIYDAQGNELAYDDDYRFDPDPVVFCQIPEDGSYVLEIKDSIYRGREDFVYRITAGELPFVTSVFPLGGQAGVPTAVELQGWNLPMHRLTVSDEGKGPGVRPLSVRKEQQISNRVPFVLDTLPEAVEQEPNSGPADAQRVTPPLVVNGRIDRPGDCDVFRFEGRAGIEIVAEVHARRLGSPLDSVLKLTDATGRQIAANDDYDDKGSGLLTHHADSWLSAKLPADGTYYLHLGDSQQKGGEEYAYRLRISPPRPDFELRVVPSSITARPGLTVPITVYALRRDGFSGDITLGLKDAPAGFALGGAWVPSGQDQVRLTLAVPTSPQAEPYSLHLEGRATIQGREVSRLAVPAEDMMQAFAYRHLVPAEELKVAIVGRSGAKVPVRILGKTPVKIPAGGTARVQLGVPARGMAGQLKLELSEPPEGVSIKSVSSSYAGTEIVLQSDAAKVKPGLKGNLIVTVAAGRAGPAAKAKVKPAAGQRAIPLATLPAIPFEIVGP